MYKGTILSVEDDENLQFVLSEYLSEDGYRVLLAKDFKSAQAHIANTDINVVLLDLVLPDGDGLSLISLLKSSCNAGIIVLSGKDDTTEKVVCLEMGADDYLTKPFEMREMAARIKAVMRRLDATPTVAATESAISKKWRLPNGWILDQSSYQLFDAATATVPLTTGEFKLLQVLVEANNRVLSREQLFDLTREGDGNFDVYDRAVDIQIARLRKKIGDTEKPPTIIKTVRGVGYMLCGQVSHV